MRIESYICTLFESQVDSSLKKILSVHGNTVMSVSDQRNVVRKSFCKADYCRFATVFLIIDCSFLT